MTDQDRIARSKALQMAIDHDKNSEGYTNADGIVSDAKKFHAFLTDTAETEGK